MKTFDFNKISDFDEHIRMSIPNYEFLVEQVKMLVEAFAEKGFPVVDVGCSTGSLIDSLDIHSTTCYGIDNSDLIQTLPHVQHNKSFIKQDFFEWDMPRNCSVVTCIFFLQFLGYADRLLALRKIIEHMIPKGRLIICEKTYFHDTRIEHIMNSYHLQQKRHSFDDKNILDKNIELSNSMKLSTDIELLEDLKEYGDVTVFFKSLGFTGYIVKVNK